LDRDQDHLSEEVVKIELIFAEFGERACPVDRKHFQTYFPDAEIVEISEEGRKYIGDPTHPRFGWRMNDYHKVCGLVESAADIAISFDADMRIVSDQVKSIIDLVSTFGLCLQSVRVGWFVLIIRSGKMARFLMEDAVRFMHAVNCGIIALDKSNERAMFLCKNIFTDHGTHPHARTVAWAKAFYITEFSPCLLPAQWVCLCAEDAGCGNEIVLHAGHQKVREHYAAILLKPIVLGSISFIHHLDHLCKIRDGAVVAPLHVSVWPTIECQMRCEACCCKDEDHGSVFSFFAVGGLRRGYPGFVPRMARRPSSFQEAESRCCGATSRLGLISLKSVGVQVGLCVTNGLKLNEVLSFAWSWKSSPGYA
jgi:hypothetical protein